MLSYKTIDLRCNQALFWHVVALVYTWCVDAHLLYLQSPLWLLTYCMLFDFLIFLDTREMYVWMFFCSLQTVCICSVPWQSHNANSMFSQNMKSFWECKHTYWNKCCHVKSELLNMLSFFFFHRQSSAICDLCCFVVQQFLISPCLHTMWRNISLPLMAGFLFFCFFLFKYIYIYIYVQYYKALLFISV